MLTKKRPILIVIVLIMALVITAFPASTPADAQGQTIDVILRYFSSYMGINPPLRQNELDLSDDSRSFWAEYEYLGLDLNPTNGNPACDSRILAEDEQVRGFYGFVVYIDIQNRRYEVRTNSNGTSMIRCSGGQQVGFDTTGRGFGTSITGEAATILAMKHVSNYLELSTVITPELVELDYDELPEDFPLVWYRYYPVAYDDASLGCPYPGIEYDVRDTLAHRVQMRVDGRFFDYRVRIDGQQIIMCRGGRADPSSTGLVFPVEDSDE